MRRPPANDATSADRVLPGASQALAGASLALAFGCAMLAGCSALAPAEDPRPTVRGPLPVITNGAIRGTLLQFRPRSPQTSAPGALDLAVTSEYSSLFENATGDGAVVVIDTELWRTGIGLRTGLTERTDVEIEVPLVYASAGFADQLIESWHNLLGLPNGGRDKRPQNEFEVRVDKDGQRIFMLEDDDLAFGDVPIVVTQRIVDEAEHGVSVALRAGLELPLGSESNGFGNGGIDWGVGLLAETSENRLTLTGGAYYVLVSTPDSFEGTDVEIADQVQLHGGLEVRWNDDASIVLGLRWNTPTTRDIRIKEVDSSVLDLDLGWVQDLGCGSQLLFGFTEDLVAESGPDLTVFAGWRGGF